MVLYLLFEGVIFMRILGSFIDCIYESNVYEQDMKKIRQKLE